MINFSALNRRKGATKVGGRLPLKKKQEWLEARANFASWTAQRRAFALAWSEVRDGINFAQTLRILPLRSLAMTTRDALDGDKVASTLSLIQEGGGGTQADGGGGVGGDYCVFSREENSLNNLLMDLMESGMFRFDLERRTLFLRCQISSRMSAILGEMSQRSLDWHKAPGGFRMSLMMPSRGVDVCIFCLETLASSKPEDFGYRAHEEKTLG